MGGRGSSGKSKGGGGGSSNNMRNYGGIRAYKGYSIEQLTKTDYIIRDMNGNMVEPPEGKWSFRTLKASKRFIDTIS